MKKIFFLMVAQFACFTYALPQPPALPVIVQPQFKKDTFNILRYGARADGITLNTTAINNAITACSAKGGGVVLVPAGLWLTGPLVLKSHVNLHLQAGAILQFTTDFDQYSLVQGNWEGQPQMRNQSPISAIRQQDIAITGSGIIDGGGDAWRMVKKEKLTESQWKKLVASGGVLGGDSKTWYPSQKSLHGSQMKDPGLIQPGRTAAFYDSVKDFLRPNLLVLMECKRVLLDGITIRNSPAWCLHPLMCEQLTVRNVTVNNPWYAQNGDGIDVESCKNVLIENSVFDVGDDGICVKSGRDGEGRRRNMPTENMIVRHCTVYHAHGGFVIGSEMSGGVRNMFVSDCSFIGTDVGLRFKTARGRGGVVEKIYVSRINMKDIAGEAILFDMYYMARDPVPLTGEKREAPKVEFQPVADATPRFRDFTISNVVCNGAEKALFIRGLPEMNVTGIRLEDMVMVTRRGIECSEAQDVQIRNIQLITKETEPLVDILNSRNIVLDHVQYAPSPALLFRIGGDRTGNITVSRTNTDQAKEKARFEFGASEQSLKMK